MKTRLKNCHMLALHALIVLSMAFTEDKPARETM